MRLRSGDLVLLIDGRSRRYLIKLIEGDVFHSHHGVLKHDELIGLAAGSVAITSLDRRIRVLKPTLADYVLKMPRGATVVYPKELGQILIQADIAPGSRVLEAGTGSGSLTLALLRAVGPSGVVYSYDRREDFHQKALRNIERWGELGGGRLDARLGDVYEDEIDIDVDRVVLDLTEPWLALPNVLRCLEPGGILCVYMPAITQVQRLAETLNPGQWTMISTFETLQRGWKVDGLAVRPNHRMVAHTAFLVTARRLG